MFVLAAVCGHAQNANRNGFFIEAGVGALIGNTPYASEAHFSDGNICVDRLKGALPQIDLGYRFATSSHMAFEVKAMGALPVNKASNFMLYLMPGIRYTSSDFGSNMSFFGALNIGAGMFSTRGNRLSRYDDDEELVATGVYELTLGLNFTPSFYAGIGYDGFLMFDRGSFHFGAFGVKLGYRF